MSMEWQAKVVAGGKWYRREAWDVEIWGGGKELQRKSKGKEERQ